ncbi:MAG: class I SAM-dependent methyltransferase [Actinomycetota bacterium]
MKARDPAWRTHTRHESLDLRRAWERNAASFIAWARKPGLDSYWRFHRDQFFDIVPGPGRLTVDIGCGEGRVAQDLTGRGHRVVGVDASATMIAHAKEANPDVQLLVADAAALPLGDSCSDLAIAFMSLQDVDDLERAVRETARVLDPGGRFCLAIVHPINSAGHFEDTEDESPFIIPTSYLDPYFYEDVLEREGVSTTFASIHRPLETYVRALADAGFLIELLREPAMPDGAGSTRPNDRRWQRIPMFLHVRAVRT